MSSNFLLFCLKELKESAIIFEVSKRNETFLQIEQEFPFQMVEIENVLSISKGLLHVFETI